MLNLNKKDDIYKFYKDDPWGNKVPLMDVVGKDAADNYLRENRHVITRVVDVPRGKDTLIMM